MQCSCGEGFQCTAVGWRGRFEQEIGLVFGRWHFGCFYRSVLQQLKPRILVVDDEPAIGELLRSYFERTGEYLVATETNPYAALKRAQVFRPDLMILDVNMPGVTGLDVARAIRQEPWLRYRPIIFYTGMSQREKECYRAGGEAPTVFLLKGASLQDVHTVVEQLVAPRLELYREFRNSPAFAAA